MKTVITILVIILLAGLGYYFFIFDSGASTSPNGAPDAEEISIEQRFEGKFVYTTDTTVDATPYRRHCVNSGGTFDACGSTCAPGADMCAQVCAYTCSFSVEDN